MATLQTPPGEEQPLPPAPPDEARAARFRRSSTARYDNLQQHELVMLLDEQDDERSRARFRESIYISVITWLLISWVLVYGPRYLWHAPVLISPVPEKRNTMTYLDVPPDLQKQLQRTKPAPNMSTHSTEAQSPKPSPQAPQPRAGTPAPPAPRPTPAPQPQQPAQPQPQQPPQQTARNAPPTPTPRPAQPLADAPTPNQPGKPIFNNPSQSAGQAIQQAARGARGGESGDYGSVGRGQTGGTKVGTQILSDTQGVDFAKYLARLLADVKRGWLPLIPEECRPPLNKQGITGVRFTIQPDGRISAMHLDYSTHDVAIDRAAWGSITGLGAAQPLPKEFHGPNLELRIEFRINKDGSDAD